MTAVAMMEDVSNLRTDSAKFMNTRITRFRHCRNSIGRAKTLGPLLKVYNSCMT